MEKWASIDPKKNSETNMVINICKCGITGKIIKLIKLKNKITSRHEDIH